MDDIKINSQIDLKTYFKINLLIQFRKRSIIFMILYFVLVQFCLFYDSKFDWTEEIIVAVIFIVLYGGLIPLFIYFAGRRNMKKIISLGEPKVYIINNEKIELRGETLSSTLTWPHITKLIESEKYFLLMPTARSFYYLPKESFESIDKIEQFKSLVKEKGIKI
jgi:hypothetical protein